MNVRTNIFRCTEYCNNCPFLDNGKKIHLNDGRVADIKKYLELDDRGSFTCHKTVYNLDDKMEETEHQDPKMCKGAYDHLKKINKPNFMMRLATHMGVDND